MKSDIYNNLNICKSYMSLIKNTINDKYTTNKTNKNTILKVLMEQFKLKMLSLNLQNLTNIQNGGTHDIKEIKSKFMNLSQEIDNINITTLKNNIEEVKKLTDNMKVIDINSISTISDKLNNIINNYF
jgi:hypothetical protein